MTTIQFRQIVETVKYITVEIPDLDLFKEEAKKLVENEGSLDIWNLEDELSDYCKVTYGEEWIEEDNDEFYEHMDDLNVIWNDELLLDESK